MSSTESIASRLLGRPVGPVEVLRGGEHAVTTAVTDGTVEYVVRCFPAGDPAVEREVDVLHRLGGLGELAPSLVAVDPDPAAPTIITTRLPGRPPAADLSLDAIADGMAWALARVHALDGVGLPRHPTDVPTGEPTDAPVFSHGDFWCGNALWEDERLSGVVDWSGARLAPRGFDLAWCRLDLVLMGSLDAAERFTAGYERHVGRPVDHVHAWDRDAAARADPNLETWSPNYVAIGRSELTGPELRRRFTDWTAALVRDS